MYIRKSVLNGLIILTGLCILIAMALSSVLPRHRYRLQYSARLDYLSAVRISLVG